MKSAGVSSSIFEVDTSPLEVGAESELVEVEGAERSMTSLPNRDQTFRNSSHGRRRMGRVNERELVDIVRLSLDTNTRTRRAPRRGDTVAG